jgi:hypothetical protein
MHPFWQPVVEPLLDAAGARTVVEIGSERGLTTGRLLAWSARTGATVHAIDPAPRFDVARWELEHGERFRMYRSRSLDALGRVGPVDAALVDGDHNWFTVISELRLLAAAASGAGRPLPLVIAHDAGWPYGRRDMYYDPRQVPDEHRHDAARAGIAPGRSELGDPGINAGLWNATAEGGPRNGVLTAIEDFVAEHPEPCELVVLEGMHGLAVLCSETRAAATPALGAELERLRSPAFQREWLEAIERSRIAAIARADSADRRRAATERRIAELEHRLLDEPETPDDRETLGGEA